MATYSPDEIRAALANAKAAGDAEAVATLEAALSAPAAAAGPEPTQARAVERGAEQFLAWGFAPEVRGLAAAARSVTLPEATALGAEAEKLRGRELAFQARGGTFGPMQGEWPHFTPPETSDLMRRQRGAYEAEVGREEALGRELASRYPVEYYGPQVAGGAMALLRGGFKALAPAFARRAETKVLQAAKNPAGVGQLAEEALGAPAAAAREVLAQGVPLKSPRATYEALAPLAHSVGQEVENIAAAAGRRGAAFDVRNVYRQVAQSTQEMAREPLVRKYVDDALAYIQQSAASRGKPGAVAFMEPSEAHRWRKALDDVLYGMANQLDPTGKVTAQARLAVRRAVSDELGRAIGSAGDDLAAAWAEMNPLYGRLKDAVDIFRGGAVGQIREAARPTGFQLPLAISPSGPYGRLRMNVPFFGAGAGRSARRAEWLRGAAEGLTYSPARTRAQALRSAAAVAGSGPEEEEGY